MEDGVLTENDDSCKWSFAHPVSPNPFVSLLLLQSGTLGKEASSDDESILMLFSSLSLSPGNDVYRKNAWLAWYLLGEKRKKKRKHDEGEERTEKT